ncbi:MAG: M48 family metalloprotease [Bdellovibrionales bacterium]|nr:M48 family metalloprotease [Bdellovibrionales bacterium]
MNRHVARLAIGALALGVGCAGNPELQNLGTSILTSAGLSSSQAQALFAAGEQSAKAADGLTAEEEYFLGRSVSASLLAKYPPNRDRRLNDYVSRIGSVLAAASDRPETFAGYRFQVLDSSEVNAFAAPGGFIFVTRGLLELVADEDELAAVLAHEVAHVVAEDGVKAVSSANMSQALSILGKQALNDTIASRGGVSGQALGALTETFSSSVDDVVQTLVVNGYSRSQEYDADRYAALLLARAGYNPASLTTVLEKLEQAARGGGGMFDTHPAPQDRLATLGSLEVRPPAPHRTQRFARATAKL